MLVAWCWKRFGGAPNLAPLAGEVGSLFAIRVRGADITANAAVAENSRLTRPSPRNPPSPEGGLRRTRRGARREDQSPQIVSPNNSHVSPANRRSRITRIGKSKATQRRRALATSSLSHPGFVLLVLWVENRRERQCPDGDKQISTGRGWQGRRRGSAVQEGVSWVPVSA